MPPEGRYKIPALEQFGVHRDDHAVAADPPAPHTGMHVLGGVAVPLERDLGALQLIIDVHDQCPDIAADIEHDRPAVRCLMLVAMLVRVMHAVGMVVTAHGAPTDSGCTS